MSGSLIGDAANVISKAFVTNHGQDPYREAAVLLSDRQMLTSPERAARIADLDRAVLVELLRGELAELERAADTKLGGQRAGMLLAVRWMSRAVDRLLESPARPVSPEVAAMVREGAGIAADVAAGDETAGGAR
ncbi:hypothetical protein [Embleya sp. NPDC005971]|uniref:hypothetical protein n=1 Tax=Embleya sp. NPDC005971 TaxID=3156724 RepID=UPI0033EF3761